MIAKQSEPGCSKYGNLFDEYLKSVDELTKVVLKCHLDYRRCARQYSDGHIQFAATERAMKNAQEMADQLIVYLGCLRLEAAGREALSAEALAKISGALAGIELLFKYLKNNRKL